MSYEGEIPENRRRANESSSSLASHDHPPAVTIGAATAGEVSACYPFCTSSSDSKGQKIIRSSEEEYIKFLEQKKEEDYCHKFNWFAPGHHLTDQTVNDRAADQEYSWHIRLHKAAFEGNWRIAEPIIQEHQEAAFTAQITRAKETVLHVAVGRDRAIRFLRKLVCDREHYDDMKVQLPILLEQKDGNGKTALDTAAKVGNIKAARILVKANPNLPNIQHDKTNFVPLHYAVEYGHREMVEYLLTVTKDIECDQKNNPFAGKTGVALLNLLIAADFHGIALDLVRKHRELVLEKDDSDVTAIQTLAQRVLAFGSGNHHGYWKTLIYTLIPVKHIKIADKKHSASADKRDMDNSTPKSTKVGDVENPNSGYENILAFPAHKSLRSVVFDASGSLTWWIFSLFYPRINNLCEKKVMHIRALELLKFMCREITLNKNNAACWELLETPMRTAAKLGIHEIVTEIIQWHPGLIWSYDEIKRQSIFHIAVEYRYHKIFSLVYQLGSSGKHPATELKGMFGNNILHLAGRLSPPGGVAGAALHFQRELQWFEEVKKCVQPSYREMVNSEGRTPRQEFTKHHKELHEQGEKWMMDTATSCSVVAALILTVMFAAAFTLPGGINVATDPVFLNRMSFMVFSIADAIGLFSSSAAVLMFLGILTSRYAEEDFLVSLPTKLLIGLLTLFLSIAAMMVAFGATLYLNLVERVTWIVIPIAVLAVLPMSLFAMLLFPLTIDIFLNTCGNLMSKKKDFVKLKYD